jgi:hypothetical protein
MNPIALVHPTNTISPLEILEHLDPLFGGGDLRQQSRLFDLRAPRCAAASVPRSSVRLLKRSAAGNDARGLVCDLFGRHGERFSVSAPIAAPGAALRNGRNLRKVHFLIDLPGRVIAANRDKERADASCGEI